MQKPKGFEALEAIEESVYELYHAKKYENKIKIDQRSVDVAFAIKIARKNYPKIIVDEIVTRAFQRAASLYPLK